MAGSPPKPPPPTFAVGSSSPKPPPLTFPGYHPSYEQLIGSYLRPRVVFGTEADFIHDADLYSADPYQLTGNHAAAIASDGERAWYFYTHLRLKGSSTNRMKRNVDAGRQGSWVGSGGAVNHDVLSKGQRLGQRLGFDFQEKVDGNRVKTPWRMMELRLDPNVGGQRVGSPNFLVLSKVYLSRNANAEDESSMAVAKADAEAPAASAAVTPGPKGADEEIGAETAAGPGRKRKASDKDSGAGTVASSPGRQNKADGESADAATTGENLR